MTNNKPSLLFVFFFFFFLNPNILKSVCACIIIVIKWFFWWIEDRAPSRKPIIPCTVQQKKIMNCRTTDIVDTFNRNNNRQVEFSFITFSLFPAFQSVTKLYCWKKWRLFYSIAKRKSKSKVKAVLTMSHNNDSHITTYTFFSLYAEGKLSRYIQVFGRSKVYT